MPFVRYTPKTNASVATEARIQPNSIFLKFLFKTNKMLDKLKLFMEKLLEKDTIELKLTILTNETAKKNRKELESSDVVLSNYKMFSAGADVPHLSCIFFASMVLSKTMRR